MQEKFLLSLIDDTFGDVLTKRAFKQVHQHHSKRGYYHTIYYGYENPDGIRLIIGIEEPGFPNARIAGTYLEWEESGWTSLRLWVAYLESSEILLDTLALSRLERLQLPAKGFDRHYTQILHAIKDEASYDQMGGKVVQFLKDYNKRHFQSPP